MLLALLVIFQQMSSEVLVILDKIRRQIQQLISTTMGRTRYP